MLLALTGGQKLGIALVAAAFIAFALASSFYFPRRDPNFPGRRLRLFVVVAVLFFAGMLTAMVLLAKEEPEGEAHGVPATDTVATGTSATTGGPRETETGAGGDGGEVGQRQGDAEAGRALFDEQGCGGCHVLEAAGSTGTVGPNLDESGVTFEAAVRQITNGGGGMPPYGDRLEEQQIRDLAAFVTQSE